VLVPQVCNSTHHSLFFPLIFLLLFCIALIFTVLATSVNIITTMAAAPAKNLQKLIQNSHIIKRGAEKARQDIFGHLPQLNLDHTGNKAAKKGFMGPYLERYYPTSINVYARKVRTDIMIGYCEFILRLNQQSLT
jgi:hypothetical protein